jgi:hypothetical protein
MRRALFASWLLLAAMSGVEAGAATTQPACRRIAEKVGNFLQLSIQTHGQCDFVFGEGERTVRVVAARSTKTDRRSCPKGCVSITKVDYSCRVVRNDTTATINSVSDGHFALSICRAWFAAS